MTQMSSFYTPVSLTTPAAKGSYEIWLRLTINRMEHYKENLQGQRGNPYASAASPLGGPA